MHRDSALASALRPNRRRPPVTNNKKVKGDHTGDVELVVAKNRTGGTGVVTAGWAAYQARIA